MTPANPSEPLETMEPAATKDPTRPKRILVVDDDLDSAIMLGLLLRHLGYIVITAETGEQAMEWGDSLLPDVVLLDLAMPGMDGFETCRSVRLRDWGVGTTVIAITGHDEREDRARSKEAGFDLHLVKPVDPALIRRVLTSAPYLNTPPERAA